MRVIKLTRSTQQLLDAFDESALDWGWNRDQGSAAAAAASEVAYVKAHDALVRRIDKLERELRRHRVTTRGLAA